MDNFSPPWDAYFALMAFRLGVIDKRLGVQPVRIGETLCWSLAKLVMRAVWDQAETACGNLQLCTGLNAVIEAATYAMGKRRLDREN